MLKQRYTLWGTFVLVARESIRSFSINGNLEMAATLAYYAALALMPLLLLVVILLGSFMQSSEAVSSAIQQAMSNLFPSSSGSMLDDLLRLSRGKAWGILGVILLFWSVTPFAAAFRSAMTRTFRAPHKLHFLKAKVLDVFASLAVLVLFLFLVLVKAISAPAGHLSPGLIMVVLSVLRLVALFLLSVAVLVFFYRVFATEKIRLVHLLGGAVTAAILLAIFRPLFGLILHYNPNYGYAFGSLKVIFLLIIWVYYTFAVVLLGAEVSAAIRRRNALLLSQLFVPHGDTGRATQKLFSKFLRRHDMGDILFKEGDRGNSMFYVQSGRVDIRKGDRLLKTVGPGNYLGEMAMLLDSPRTATAAVAAPDTELIEISDDNFEIILRENPQIVRRFLNEIATRLKETSDQLRKHETPAPGQP